MTASIAPGRSGGRVDLDMWVRRGCALIVAAVATYSSFEHQRGFALRGGADATNAMLWPLSVDGLLLLATVGLLKPPVPPDAVSGVGGAPGGPGGRADRARDHVGTRPPGAGALCDVRNPVRSGQWGGRRWGSGVETSLASNCWRAESPTTCGACASTGTVRSVVSVPGATLIWRGIAAQASAAWEDAVCWDDGYAVKRLAEVRAV
jgi:hypothetical protein